MKSDGASTESRRTKTPLTTGTVATEPLVWTRAVRASSGAMPTSSRIGIPAGACFAGGKEMLPKPCLMACWVLAQIIKAPGVSGTSETMQRWPTPGTSQWLPDAVTGIRCANAGFITTLGIDARRRKRAGSPSGRVRSKAKLWRCMRDGRSNTRGAGCMLAGRGSASSGVAEPHEARPAASRRVTSEPAQARRLTVVAIMRAVRIAPCLESERVRGPYGGVVWGVANDPRGAPGVGINVHCRLLARTRGAPSIRKFVVADADAR